MSTTNSLTANSCGLTCALVFSAGVSLAGSRPSEPFAGEAGRWHGYERFVFTVAERSAIVVAPQTPAPGKPWIWRARFWGHEPQTDLALLQRGFHVVYVDVAGMYGSPAAVAVWDQAYELFTQKHGFAAKVALEGMSRGGLIVYNWASAHPDRVACIYADAPVCDFKSWPRNKAPANWQECLRAYGLTEEEALAYPGNPLDSLEGLAKAGVPLLHVCGADDTTVPVAENTAVMANRYRDLGGRIEVIMKENCGHHPHSLKDPAPIVRFILKHTVEDLAR